MKAARRSTQQKLRPVSLQGLVVLPGSHTAQSVLPPHSHELPSICCVQSGGFTEHYRGRSVECAPGMLKVTPAGDVHWNRFGPRPTAGLRIDVDPARFDDLPAVRRVLDDRVFARDAMLDATVMRLVRALRDTQDDAGMVAVEGILLELVGRLARSRMDGDTSQAEWLLRAYDMVNDLYPSRLSLSSIAAAVGVHPATLARAYRTAFNCTVGEHIRRLRLERAAAELVATDLPVSMVAVNCGFYDQSHFSHAFRRRYSCTPGEYRRSAPPSRH